ncbi:MAG: Y-family DNA polymerase, partial [Thermoanaerobaculia bacterium]
AMPAAQAVKLCPHGIFLPPRMGRYAAVSRRVFAALSEFSPLVEPVSIDEAFLDLTGAERLLGPPVEAARALKARVRDATGGLTASVGIAPNKFLAKVASDLEKPDGLVVVPRGREAEFLAPLPVGKLWGVGPRTAEALRSRGFRKIEDLQRTAEAFLRQLLGEEAGRHLHLLARGIDERPVAPSTPAKSVSSETTFARFIPSRDLEAVDRALLALSEEVGQRLREIPASARCVVLKVRDERFKTLTRSRTLAEPTQLAEEIYARARALFRERVDLSGRAVRLLGVAASELVHAEAVQLDLFESVGRERAARMARAVDRIREKLGEDSLRRASLVGKPGNGSPRRPRRGV